MKLRTLTLVVALLTKVAFAIPSHATTRNVAAQDARPLRAELTAGVLLANHGVADVCGKRHL